MVISPKDLIRDSHTVFENHNKCLIQPENCGQAVLPDRSISISQKLVKNTKIRKLKCDISGDF